MIENSVYGICFASCVNIIFNELRQQRVKYVHTTSKINSINAIFYHILFLLLIYFNWNYFVMRSNTIRWAWVELLSKEARENIVSCVCLYNSAIYFYNIMFSIYYIASKSNQVCLWLPYYHIKYHKVSITYSYPFCCERRGSGLDVMTSALQCTGTTFVLIVLIRIVYCRRWKAKDVLLAFWLAALRLMDQSQEILLGHSVLCY